MIRIQSRKFHNHDCAFFLKHWNAEKESSKYNCESRVVQVENFQWLDSLGEGLLRKCDWIAAIQPTHTHTHTIEFKCTKTLGFYPWKKIRSWWGPIINYPRPVAHSWELWTQGTCRQRCSWDLIFGLLGSMMMTPMISMASISQIPCQAFSWVASLFLLSCGIAPLIQEMLREPGTNDFSTRESNICAPSFLE